MLLSLSLILGLCPKPGLAEKLTSRLGCLKIVTGRNAPPTRALPSLNKPSLLSGFNQKRSKSAERNDLTEHLQLKSQGG